MRSFKEYFIKIPKTNLRTMLLKTFAQPMERVNKLQKTPLCVKKLAKIFMEKIFTLAHEVGKYHG
jgi:hypothetical protein